MRNVSTNIWIVKSVSFKLTELTLMGTIQKFLLDYRVNLRYYYLRMRRDNVFSRICLPVSK